MKPELLCPVGGPRQLKAALRFGADAVYMGAQAYGLRAFAGVGAIRHLGERKLLLHEAAR